MDIEAVVASQLKEQTGIEAFLTVPKDAPDEFMVVSLTGMSGGAFQRFCTLEVIVWGKDDQDRKRAFELAQKIMFAASSLDAVDNIFQPEATNCYRTYDADTGRACYCVQIELSVCE